MCLRLGYRHPDDLIAALTPEQWSDWQAYDRVSPVADERMDLLLSRLSAQIASFAGSPTTVAEAMPTWGEEDRTLDFLAELVRSRKHGSED